MTENPYTRQLEALNAQRTRELHESEAIRNELLAQVQLLQDGIRAQDRFIAEQNAALRDLLAYVSDPQYPPEVAEVQRRLAGILNNVTGVERPVDPQTGLDL